MSAIAGIWRMRGGPAPAQDCARMLGAQSIYGRDKENIWADGAFALGMRLSKLLPEDAYDKQPLVGGGGRYVLAADLRLDNREDLISDLDIPPTQARTMCDAAILLMAFERWDEDCCDRLVGDYAFALWDTQERRLVLARDFLGMRPLHYHRGKDFFAFASMPKGLHSLVEIPRAPDEERVAEFIALLPEHGSQSFFKDIERVEAAHIVTITPSGLHTRRHWNWRRRTLVLPDAEDYVEGLRHHLDQAVQSRLRGANGMVAAHLSAGFDSSSVAATAARLLAPDGGKVIAFTAAPRKGYDLPVERGKIGDEGPLAAATAAMYPNMEHVQIRSGRRSPLAGLDRSFFLFDRPMYNLCNNVWIDAINEEAQARKLTVLLIAQMGNMSVSYDGRELLAELVRAGDWIKWGRTVRAMVRTRHMRLRGVMKTSFAPWLPISVWRWLSKTFEGHNWEIDRYTAINASRLSELDLVERGRKRGLDPAFRPFKDGVAMRLWALGCFDLGVHCKGVLGGWGLDMRDPTADRRLVEYCLSVPTEQFNREGVLRALPRAALADRLPPEVLGERRKGRQAVDWHEGLTAARDELGEEIARLEQCAPATRALDVPRLRKLSENWPSGGWERVDIIEQYRLALLRGISAGHFLRKASGSNA